MEISQDQYKAAVEIVDLIAHTINRNGEVHSATAITAAARLSGTFLFKTFGLDIKNIKPGTAVFSEQANEEGPELINVIGVVLSNIGVTIDNQKMETAEIQEAELNFLQCLEITFSKANEIRIKCGLNEKDMAIACAMSTAIIIQHCQKNLDAESGFNTAIYGLIEGSKTFPPEMNE